MPKNFLTLLVILLGFSYVLFVSAIPSTRTKKLNGEDAYVIPSSTQHKDSLKLENGEDVLFDMNYERLMERRMDLDIQDYGGTGANKDHDPKTPGNR